MPFTVVELKAIYTLLYWYNKKKYYVFKLELKDISSYTRSSATKKSQIFKI